MKFIASTLIFAIFSFLAVIVSGAPIDLIARDVYVPPVITPDSHSVWIVGTTQTVTWDVSDPPKQITNPRAKIILVTNGRLDLANPLADDINVLLGKCDVTVPNVEPGNFYQILLFGDSGNTGEKFTIAKDQTILVHQSTN